MVQLVVVGNKSYSVSGSQFGRGAICRQFWWEVASSRFCASKPLFWLVEWWRGRIWCGGKPICRRAPSITDFRWRWLPAYRMLPTRQVWWGSFSGCVARVVSGCVAWVVSGCVARVVFWLCRQGYSWLCCQVCSLTVLSEMLLVGSSPGYPGCVIKG